jgi:hypothetical protein
MPGSFCRWAAAAAAANRRILTWHENPLSISIACDLPTVACVSQWQHRPNLIGENVVARTLTHALAALIAAPLIMTGLGGPAVADAPPGGTATSRIKDLANIEGVHHQPDPLRDRPAI